MLSKAEKVGQHQQLLLPLGGGIGFLLHEQLHHHLVVAVHRGNPPNTLWAVANSGTVDIDGCSGKTTVGDGGGAGGGYDVSFWVGGQRSGTGETTPAPKYTMGALLNAPVEML